MPRTVPIPFLLIVPALLHAATTVTLTSSANPAIFGQSVNLIAKVIPSTATGSVTFYSGVTILGTDPISSGTATLHTILLPEGAQSLKAYFGGDSSNSPSTSATLSQTVNAGPGNGFKPLVSLPGGTTCCFASGDFNNDGKLDLVTLDSGVIAVSLNNGDGTFQAPITYSTGGSANAVLVGDFNGDGKLDVAFSVPQIGTSMMFGNGNGTFQAPLSITIGFGQGSLVVDFNGDGKADILSSGGVELGNGDGTFQPPLSIGTLGAGALAVGDFNGDGKVDIASALSNPLLGLPTVSVALGNGDGTFQTPWVYTYTVGYPILAAVAVADFNGDGKADLAIAVGEYGAGVSVLLGNGDGTFQASIDDFGDNAMGTAIAAGDFNGDGKLDVVTTNYALFNLYINSMNVLLGNGDGTFQAPTVYPLTAYLYGPPIVVGDFNSDGTADVATSLGLFIANTGKITSTTLTSSPKPSLYGKNVTLNAAVTPATATGTVQFLHGSTEIGSASVRDGEATFTISTLSVGYHSIIAAYSGDSADQPSTSFAVTQVVLRGTTSTTLTSSPNPSKVGHTVNLVAAVTPAAATGTVTFSHGSTMVGTAPLVNGTATLPVSTLAKGAHSLTALYNGGATYAPSVSPSVTQIVE